ncbi:hypothetical protein BACCIP111895_02275 [Neobacillus rhizosphaerae]|uniref:Uncharacterized protein n=1 Tax=Neobacillus rhizosphaerae TaxID=2880965 RepID=A0ABN8KNG1_9BACI|nr:hypothetical protein [Neobacillus rhizosphaerae]CAH2715091.1 hypothetical protein BACCIP111895_02275 [Neobacillus rhizosphaerae]
MLAILKEWLSLNEKKLEGLGIKLDDLTHSVESSPDPSLRVDHISNSSMGRITVWSSKKVDIEVVDFNTGDTKLYEQKEINDDMPNFDLLLEQYIKEMQ